MDKQPTGIGLDIGGANLKAACATGTAILRPFELWRRPGALASELAILLATLPRVGRYAITMTGELCDCFETKRAGVNAILDAVEACVPAARVRVWSTAGRFLTLDAARRETLAVAAANWHALATLAGRFAPIGAAMAIDVGSTTTDLIPLWNGSPMPRGKTDTERLLSRELIYTGIRRTPICAILGEHVMAEHFATALDAHLVAGTVAEDPGNCDTADGRPATREHAHARLARMVGGDRDTVDAARTRELAEWTVTRQVCMIAEGLRQAHERMPAEPRVAIIGGSGAPLACAAWQQYVRLTPRETDDTGTLLLSDQVGESASAAACAFALAVLSEERGDEWEK